MFSERCAYKHLTWKIKSFLTSQNSYEVRRYYIFYLSCFLFCRVSSERIGITTEHFCWKPKTCFHLMKVLVKHKIYSSDDTAALLLEIYTFSCLGSCPDELASGSLDLLEQGCSSSLTYNKVSSRNTTTDGTLHTYTRSRSEFVKKVVHLACLCYIFTSSYAGNVHNIEFI